MRSTSLSQPIRSLSILPNDFMEFPKAEIEALWCPWRVEYFEIKDRNPNFLCDAAQASDDAAHLVITRRKNVFSDDEPLSLCRWASHGRALSQDRRRCHR